MNEFNEKWINDIRRRMENHSEPLPADLWEKIDAEISTPKVIPMWRRWYSVAAAAAAIVAVSTLSVMLLENNVTDDSVKLANEIQPVAISEDILPIVNDESVIASADNMKPKSVITEKAIRNVPRTGIVLQKEVSAETVNDPDNINNASDSVSDNIEDRKEVASSDDTSDDVARKRVDMMKADREVQRRNASYLAMADDRTGKYGMNKVQVGIVAGNTPYNSSNSFRGISRLSSRKLMPQTNDIVIGESSDAGITYSQVLFNNVDKETYTEVKHHMPVSVGANVKWNINDYWGIESGLNYTYLYSELQSGANSYVEDKQKLHYVGIPLKLHRSIWGNKTFAFYVSAGGMVEKCVSGTLETVCVDKHRGKSSESESIEVKPWQMSVMASLGAQVNFLKFMSLYVEPGMAYYFDDNSELMTIRKEQPFNFNLQFGLRFNVGK